MSEQSRQDEVIAAKLQHATRRAEELGLVDPRKKMEYIAGFMSTTYPELGLALLRIYQPVG